MATFIHRDAEAHTNGEIPVKGSKAPDFNLTGTNLKDVHLADYAGKRIVMNIFPSIDTSTCATSVRRFNELASSLDNTIVLCISNDLPFAHRRFCGAEGISNVLCLAEYKDRTFSENYHVQITSGSTMIGLMCRAIVVIDENGFVVHSELVSNLSNEPDYDKVITALKN